MTQPGWYPDPGGMPHQRYWDGVQWTANVAPSAHRQPQLYVQGPNHALHAILTLLTFWFFGGWLWVWLIIAISNSRKVKVL